MSPGPALGDESMIVHTRTTVPALRGYHLDWDAVYVRAGDTLVAVNGTAGAKPISDLVAKAFQEVGKGL